LKPESVSTKQERIAKLAASNLAMAFTSLNHHLDAEWLRYAYECTRKDGAVGVDGQTAQEYAANLEQNLQSLMDRLKSGRYHAPPVRRHYIDKSDGSKRALGIPSFEDKVVQRAIVMLLEPIYGAPGEAWRFQRVKIPHRQGESHPTGNRALDSWR
jgi:RNA-directed DNA polymerase